MHPWMSDVDVSFFQIVKILMMLCMLDPYPMAILRLVSVSGVVPFAAAGVNAELFENRYRRCIALRTLGYTDGQRSCFTRNNGISRRQADRHASCSSRHESLLPASLC
jgi:hypothetical protein